MIVTKDIVLAYKIENLTLTGDGTVILTVISGEVLDSIFTKFNGSDKQVVIPADVVINILQEAPDATLSRLEDIRKVIYTYLLDNNIITGTLS